MTDTNLTIELPRLPDESARAYAARVEYVTMGPGRSLETVSQKYTKNIQLFKRWSVQHGWVESARQYDAQIAYLTIQEASERYRADLVDYRRRYGEVGKALLGVAARLLNKLNRSIDAIEVGPGSLALITNAAKTAADLEALALRVENLLNDEPRSE